MAAEPAHLEPVLRNGRGHNSEWPTYQKIIIIMLYVWSRLYYYLHYKRGKLRLRIRDLLKSIHSNVFTEYLQCDKEGAGERLNIKMEGFRGFPVGAVVESLPADAGDTGSCPSPGRSHMPWSGWAREPWPLSLLSATPQQ